MKQAGFKFYFDPCIVSHHMARATLGGMLRQKFLNGYWVALTLSVAPGCFSLRHFIPAAFVLALIVSAAMAPFAVSWPLVLLVGSYLACAVMATLVEAVRCASARDIALATLLPLVFLGMHLANGIGLLGGLLAIPGKLRQWKNYETPRPIPVIPASPDN